MSRTAICAGLAAFAVLTAACSSSSADTPANTDAPVSLDGPVNPEVNPAPDITVPQTEAPLPAPTSVTKPPANPKPVVRQPEAGPQLPLPTPTPTAEQEQALLAGLLRIEPGFATSGADTLVAQARKQCAQMMAASPLPRETLVNSAVIRFTSPNLGPISQTQGAAVVDLIASTFCR